LQFAAEGSRLRGVSSRRTQRTWREEKEEEKEESLEGDYMD
jgi:hypothetical protein